MQHKNKYSKNAKISAVEFKAILKLFSLDLTATQISKITKLNRNTINRYVKKIRERIAEECRKEASFCGIIELDESYFGEKRKITKRGRGCDKIKVFGIFKRNGCVFTEIVPDCSAATLQKIIRGKVDVSSVICSDGWRGYNGLVDLGYQKHLRINHELEEFSRSEDNFRVHINGIEGFWGLCKSRFARFKGLAKQTFYLHLKESEFRFNNRKNNIYKTLLKLFKNNPLF